MSDRETRKNEMFGYLYSPMSGPALRKACSDYVNGVGPHPREIPGMLNDRIPARQVLRMPAANMKPGESTQDRTSPSEYLARIGVEALERVMPNAQGSIEVVNDQTGRVLGAFERLAAVSSSSTSWDNESRLDDGPAMHVIPTAPNSQWFDVGYECSEPQDILEQTQVYHDSIVSAVWNSERGHISKTELETALRNMAGYAYQRGYESGWSRAVTKAQKLLQKFLP
jgi:hypothetical protein